MEKEILEILEELTSICKNMADKLYDKSNFDDTMFNIYSVSSGKIYDRILKL